MRDILITFGCIYLLLGAIVTTATHEPEQDGWFWSLLLWPLVLFSRRIP